MNAETKTEKTKAPPAIRQKKQVESTKSTLFPIVGIGASAGGLEALELFLKHVPSDSGMACVIIQHLDPIHKGMMPELLQRITEMKVMQVKDRTKIKPNCVYVIPPNKDMSILHGVLHLLAPAAPRGLRLPIDFFSALSHRTGKSTASESSCPAWGPTVLKGYAPLKKRQV